MMIKLDNLYAWVVSATDDERAWVDGFLSFEEGSGFFKDRGGKTRHRAPRVQKLYDILSHRFPAGLTATVKREGEKKGFKVDVVDNRVRPCAPDPTAGLSWLDDRPFQHDCVRAFHKRTRGIAWLSTGAGKTEIAVATALSLPTHWLFLSNEKDLLHNAARRWEKRTGMQAGRLGDGIWEPDPNERFTSATFQTLTHALRKGDPRARVLLARFGGVFFDEVHTLPAVSFYSVSLAIPNAYYRFGLSGTPLDRDDKKSLYAIAATGDIVFRVEPKELIDAGFIAQPIIKMVPFVHGTLAATTYAGAYSQGVVKSKKRNALVVELAKRAEKPALVFVKELKHGGELTRQLAAAGLNVEFVWGNTSTAKRDEAIRNLEWGNLDVIVCSVVFQTGTDIPDLRSLIIATAGKSSIAALQRVGRGMRIVHDNDGNVIKNTVAVYDVLDRGQKWLARHSHARQKSYMREGYPVTIIQSVAAA